LKKTHQTSISHRKCNLASSNISLDRALLDLSPSKKLFKIMLAQHTSFYTHCKYAPVVFSFDNLQLLHTSVGTFARKVSTSNYFRNQLFTINNLIITTTRCYCTLISKGSRSCKLRQNPQIFFYCFCFALT